MPVTLVLGAQCGDEGKGKITDYLAEKSDVIVRYAGGANAGHTLMVGGKKYVTHMLPSGVLYQGKDLVLGNGMVLNLRALVREIKEFQQAGFLDPRRVHISHLAHVVLPYHMILDELREKALNIGTTKQGIGPAYAAKINRIGVRICDLTNEALLKDLIGYSYSEMESYAIFNNLSFETAPEPADVLGDLLRMGELLKPFVQDTRLFLRHQVQKGTEVLLESAQGVMLDTDHGAYPWVTSSSVLSAGALLGTGLNWRDFNRVIGVAKAYMTRIANGPFPTEMPEKEQGTWREHGGEYGATTGRPRRIGWLDVPVLRYAKELNGLTELAITKVDALQGMGPVKVCFSYFNGQEALPTWSPTEVGEPRYDTIAPFSDPPVNDGKLSSPCEYLIDMVEALTELPVSIVSYGAGRENTLLR